jgi:ABC-2 type transport system ATP-binding protein
MRELLRELKNMGKTIFFSSHILSEVADICTSIAVLEAGHLVAYGDMTEMKQKLRPHRVVQVRTLGQMDMLQKVLMMNEHVDGILTPADIELPPDTIRFDFSGNDRQMSALLVDLIQGEIPVVSFSEDGGDLEDIFLQVTRGIVS